PQLVNVLRGEMSLVGPRPERPIFVERFRETMPDYDLRHAVPGGMTGWAQVHGWRGRTSLRKRIQYDLDYIQRWSFWLDFRVLVMTVQHVFWGKVAWNGGPKRRPER
ncbi:MAG TPA: sugar transferase, partial [Isosphaeraceae bacterium]|nr:sugar transferase [Isosphaeraceae bacterium]